MAAIGTGNRGHGRCHGESVGKFTGPCVLRVVWAGSIE